MNRAPAFQFYPDKWVAGTRHLTRTARAIYHDVLCWIWLHRNDFCSIPDTEQAVRLAAGITHREYERYWVKEILNPVMPLFTKDGNLLTNNGLKKEAEKQARRREKAVMANEVRWAESRKDPTRILQGYREESTPSPSPTPTVVETTSPSKKTKGTEDKPKEQKKNGWSIWIDVNRMLGREDPVSVGPNTKAASVLMKKIGDPQKLKEAYGMFLNDDDPFLVKNGHALRFLPVRVDAYLNEIADPGRGKRKDTPTPNY